MMKWLKKMLRRKTAEPRTVLFETDFVSASGGVWRDLFGDYPGDEKVRAEYVSNALKAAQLHAATHVQIGETFELRVEDPIRADGNELEVAHQLVQQAEAHGLELISRIGDIYKLKRIT